MQGNSLFASKQPIIRVLISKNKTIRIRSDKSLPLTISGGRFSNKKIRGLTLKSNNTEKILFFDENKKNIYSLKKKQKFQVKSADKRGIWVGQKRYSGKLNLYVINSDILVINVIGIEQYLSSVVGSEMPTKWPMEALKAQAIASRTYAMKQKGNNFYDIDSTQKNQVYDGLEAMTKKTTLAVRSTRSLVLTYKNKLINALFHSSSGGMTENSQDVWQNAYSYLSSVRDFDKTNPKLKWKRNFSYESLQELFPTIGGVNRINILDITKTGRVKNIELHGSKGSKKISGTEFRKLMNLNSTLVRFEFIEEKSNENLIESAPDKLKNENSIYFVKMGDSLYDIADSYKVSVDEIVALNGIKDPSLININQRLLIPISLENNLIPIKKTLVATGIGSGHGVGMSQWGARYMALKGEKAGDILRHFYKGIRIIPFKKYYL